MAPNDYTVRSVRALPSGLQVYEVVDRRGRVIKVTVSKLSYADPVRLDRVIRLTIDRFPEPPKDKS